MDEKLSGQWEVAVVWFATALIAGTGIYWYQAGFHSSRPEAEQSKASSRLTDQPFAARLWEDPVAAIDRDSTRQSIMDLKDLRGRIKAYQTRIEATTPPKEQREKIRILIVPTTARQYAEDAEQRMRDRYAVISALGVRDFVPVEPAGVGAVEIPWKEDEEIVRAFTSRSQQASLTESSPSCPLAPENDCSDNVVDSSAKAKRSMKAPFEWFRTKVHAPHIPYSGNTPIESFLPQEVDRPGYVLVLWTDEEYFRTAPLYRIVYLVKALSDSEPDPYWKANLGNVGTSSLRFYFLGPSTSSSLRRFVHHREPSFVSVASHDNKNANLPAEARAALNSVQMINWNASVPESFLLAELNNNSEPNPPTKMEWIGVPESPPKNAHSSFTSHLAQFGLKVHAAIPSDDVLARELFWELKRRGVDSANPKHHIVLISEWDTEWGRLIPITFANQAWRNAAYSSGKTYPVFHPWPDNFYHFAYLRGLDGRTADEKSPKQTLEKQENTRGAEKNANTIGHPAGRSQIDSMPRLAQTLQELDNKLREKGNQRIRAIGVLGSDVYDKLLILQAVRRYLPKALVFTTDLDARYWHPSELKATRNLIVASGFGLRLRPELQNLAPPFRDSDQSSLFNATLAALQLAPGATAHGYYKPFNTGQPRLFEIGFGWPVDISQWGPRGEAEEKHSLHPMVRQELRMGWLSIAFWGLIVAVLLILLYLLLRRLLPGWEGRSQVNELRKALLLHPDDIQSPGFTVGNVALASICPRRASFEDHLKALNEYIRNSDAEPGYINQCHGDRIKTLIELFSRDTKTTKYLTAMLDRRLHVEDAGRGNVFPAESRLRCFCMRYRAMRAIGLCACVTAALLVAAIVHDHFYNPGGEPFAWMKGVSTWPTDIILAATIVFSIWAIFHGVFALYADSIEIAQRYCLAPPEPPTFPRVGHLRLKALFTKRSRIVFDEPQDWELRAGANIGRVSADEAWAEYQERSHPRHFLRRLIRPLGLYAGIGTIMFAFFEMPFRPTRGLLNTWMDGILLIGALVTSATLTFYVVDAAGRCRKLMGLPQPLSWSKKTSKRIRQRYGFEKEEIAEWAHIQLIAERAAAVDRLVFYPLVAIALNVLAHSSIFDFYPTNLPFVGLVLINAAFAVFAMVKLGQSARKARANTIQSLRHELLASKNVSDSDQRQRVETAIKDLEEIKDGAFATIAHRPLFSATIMVCTAVAFKFMEFGAK